MSHDLYETEQRFTRQIENDHNVIASKLVIIKEIENEIPWHDSLQTHFNLFNFCSTYTINCTAYNSIENWGINNISNDSLRRQIINIFQTNLQKLERTTIEEREVQLRSYNDIISTQLDWSNLSEVRPVDYQKFLANKEFAFRLKAFTTFTSLGIRNRKAILNDIVETIKNIKIEIDRIKT